MWWSPWTVQDGHRWSTTTEGHCFRMWLAACDRFVTFVSHSLGASVLLVESCRRSVRHVGATEAPKQCFGNEGIARAAKSAETSQPWHLCREQDRKWAQVCNSAGSYETEGGKARTQSFSTHGRMASILYHLYTMHNPLRGRSPRPGLNSLHPMGSCCLKGSS